jgi:hypothetical protein
LDGVKLWLESSYNRDWVLVIDNFDDIDLKVKRYNPIERGTIMFTTHDKRRIGHGGYLSPNEGVEIPSISDQGASEILIRLLCDSELAISVHTHPEAPRQLLLPLEKPPLAIAQAAAFVRETRTQLPEYLKEFKECERTNRTSE